MKYNCLSKCGKVEVKLNWQRKEILELHDRDNCITLSYYSLQLLSLSLVIAEKVSVLTGVDVLVNLQQEPLAEFKRLKESFVSHRARLESRRNAKVDDGAVYLRELFRQLPDTFKKLSKNRRHLFWIPVQLVTPTVDNIEKVTPFSYLNIYFSTGTYVIFTLTPSVILKYLQPHLSANL